MALPVNVCKGLLLGIRTQWLYGCGKLLGPRFGVEFIAAASISSKARRLPSAKPKPFPYKEKDFTSWTYWYDSTFNRQDENSKLIIVDGNICAGKTTLVQALAKELDFHYVREASMDDWYINDYGYDLRNLDKDLPESVQSFDLAKFYSDPTNTRTAFFQLKMFELRYAQYGDALLHVLSTGQGVVMDRSVYSDLVFLKTMHAFGYVSNEFVKYMDELKYNCMWALMKPHLVIYLDVPVPILQDRIRQRGVNHEVQTNVLTKEYLQKLEDVYKQDFLPTMNKCSEVLVYDWTEFGDAELVVEDMEHVDLDSGEQLRSKLKDWDLWDDEEWGEMRFRYTRKQDLMNLLRVIPVDVPELWTDSEDKFTLETLTSEAPGMRYKKGFNAI